GWVWRLPFHQRAACGVASLWAACRRGEASSRSPQNNKELFAAKVFMSGNETETATGDIHAKKWGRSLACPKTGWKPVPLCSSAHDRLSALRTALTDARSILVSTPAPHRS